MTKTLIAIVCFVAAGVVFIMYTQPAYSTVGDMRAQISQYQEALDKAAQLQALKQKLLARLNSFNPDDVSRLQTLLPDHVDNIGLILDLDSLASRYDMALENVDVSTSDSDSDSNTGGTLGGNGQKYDSLSLHFSTNGPYDTFRAFLKDLEHSLRIVDLVSLTISPQNAPSVAGARVTPMGLYKYDITIKTYWLK